MKISYQPLVRVSLRHDYYADGRCADAFSIEPSPATRSRLDQAGLIFRALPDGFTLYTRIDPDWHPPELLRPLAGHPLRLVFLLNPVNSRFEQITLLPPHHPGGWLFRFSNLRDDASDGRLYLGEPGAANRIGPAHRLASAEVFTYRPAAARKGLALWLVDEQGNTHTPDQCPTPDTTESTSEWRVDLTRPERLPPGRYTLHDSANGSVDFYYDPGLRGRNTLGLIEIFSSLLGADGNEHVPENYRFVSGNVLECKHYTIQFESLKTVWRYNVIKRHEENTITLDGLKVSGPVEFTCTPQDARAVFTSKDPIALREQPQIVELKQQNGTGIRKLPNPAIGTSLKLEAGAFVSEVNVYV